MGTPKLSTRTASWLAWTLGALTLALTALSILLLALINYSHPGVPIYSSWLELTLTAIGYSTVGVVIISRRPENAIGWLFCTIGLLFAVDHFCSEYGIYALLASPGSLPAIDILVWISFWVVVPACALSVLLFLLFPGGRFPGSGWRWLAWLCVLLALVGTF